MNIDRVSYRAAQMPLEKTQQVQKECVQKMPKKTEETPVTLATTPHGPVMESSDKGVLQLLEQGHFNLVADLRHRIKYNDESVQKSNADTTQKIQDLNQSFITDMSAAIKTISQPDQANTVTAMKENLITLEKALSATTTDLSTTRQNAESATNNFLAQLTDLFSTPVTTEPPSPADLPADNSQTTNPTPPTLNTTITPAPDSTQSPELSAGDENSHLTPFQDQVNAYLKKLVDLLESSSSAMQITPVENVPGRAYEKFLSIYQNMIAPPTTSEPQFKKSPAATLDTSA